MIGKESSRLNIQILSVDCRHCTYSSLMNKCSGLNEDDLNCTHNFYRRNIFDHITKISEIDLPVSRFAANQPPRALLENEPRDESVEAKWEHLQYYEEKRWLQEHGGDPEQRQNGATDSSYSSLASSASSSSQSPSSLASGGQLNHTDRGRMGSTKAKLRQMKRQSWQRIKEQFSVLRKGPIVHQQNGAARNGSNMPFPVSSFSYGDFTSISTAPNGMPTESIRDPYESQQACGQTAANSGRSLSAVIPKIRSTKSMQNLEQITRDGYYNIRGVTTNLREKYHSRAELNKGRPKADYNEFWDEDSDMDEEDIRRQTLEMVGLY
eukprot:snap_masked-scaffold144_size312663-processed-gene-2.8 protein:Tk07275 transcript:snap_masked-scaffold144_size312663-processed-gene-2.8-mRNA-1 annotation:"ferrochelatase"